MNERRCESAAAVGEQGGWLSNARTAPWIGWAGLAAGREEGVAEGGWPRASDFFSSSSLSFSGGPTRCRGRIGHPPHRQSKAQGITQSSPHVGAGLEGMAG